MHRFWQLQGVLYVRSLTIALLIFNFIFAPSVYAVSNGPGPIGNTASGSSQNQSSQTPITTDQQLVVDLPIGDQRALITVSEVPESSPEEIQRLLNSPQIQNTDILLSTDQPDVVNAAVQATSGANDRRLLRIIPIGKLAGASERIASGFKTYSQNVRDTLKHDRIGLMVTTVSLGYDSMIWVHSASFDIHQKTAMILMNLVMAGTFGLDRELWGNINRPIKDRLIKVFDQFIPTERAKMLKTLSASYVSNFSLGMGIQLTRTGLLSMDHLSDVITHGSFWLTAVKLSAAVTLTSFAWSELYAGIKAEKNPVAKMFMKRLGEVRGITMAHFASISKVLQPEVYGSTPIYSYLINGTIGIFALMTRRYFINAIENSPRIRRAYKKIQTFENFINAGLENVTPDIRGTRNSNPRVVIRSCRSLFAR